MPEVGWGELLLVGSTAAVSAAWTDGAGQPDRPLKHRSRTEVRRVPAPPEPLKIMPPVLVDAVPSVRALAPATVKVLPLATVVSPFKLTARVPVPKVVAPD